MADNCICSWCGGERSHTPPDCRGCWCDHPSQTKKDLHRVRLRIAEIPKPFKDVDELLRVAGGNAYERMIIEAKQAPAWMIDNLDSHGYELLTPEGKQDAADAMLDTFMSLPAIERDAYVRRLAERMEVAEAVLRASLNEAYVARYGDLPKLAKAEPEKSLDDIFGQE